MMQTNIESIINKIFAIQSDIEFNEVALKIFRLQHQNVAIYRSYCDHLKIDATKIDKVSDIPFLPIQFFKSKQVSWDGHKDNIQKIFKSSGTTAKGRSQHFVYDLNLYERSFTEGFIKKYGNPENYSILALLPSYLEQGDSSLIYMFRSLIGQTKNEDSGFYLKNEKVVDKLLELESQSKPTLLIGVTYALLDLIEKQQFRLSHTIIMETGGMKGRRKEMSKPELHKVLCDGFGVASIHSEYGMTELLSQGYAKGEWFEFPEWMRCSLRPVNDPLASIDKPNKTGGVNIIDLANIYSCAFIATQDLGRLSKNRLKIMGRFDHSDTRGCNLMVY